MKKIFIAVYFGIVLMGCHRARPNIEMSADEDRRLGAFLSLIRNDIKDGNIEWKSRHLNGRRVSDPNRVNEVLDLVFKNIDFQNEIESQISELGGLSSSALWDRYMSVYDSATAFSDGYLQILMDADRALPASGKIVDYGGGTGIHSAGLLYFKPNRKILIQDRSAFALTLAEKKLKSVDETKERFETLVSDLTHISDIDEKTKNADGALLSNVLYAIPRNARRKVLKRIWGDLKANGILVVHDPLPETQNSPLELKNFLQHIFSDAVKNHSPARDFDYTFLAAVNRTRLSNEKEMNPFLSEAEMKRLVRNARFEILSYKKSYYGKGQFLILKKNEKKN